MSFSESLDRSLAKVQDLQSTSTLEQFMAKLCLHHQRQIVDALGFLQTEVEAVGSSCCPGPSSSKATLEVTAEADCSPVPQQENTDYPSGQIAVAVTTSSARSASQSLEMADLPDNISPVQQLTPENTDYTDTPCESCTSLTRSDPVDLRKAVALGNSRGSSFLFSNTSERDNVQQGDLLLLARKNTSAGSLAEVKKFQMLDSTCRTPVGTLDERQCNPETLLHPVRDELSLEEISLSIGRRDQLFDHPYHTEQRPSSGITKDLLVSPCPTSKSSPRTARKSSRGTYPRPRHSVCQIINDPDSHCDIVYISKPITEYEPQPPNRFFPRRNARKSTRGYTYMEEICELKTVRTLAGKSGTNKGNCPAPVLETSTSVTPKQALSKPESVPPVDIPFAGGCGETIGQNATSEQPMEKEIAGDDVAVVREADLIVENSQTGQPPFREKTTPPPHVLLSSVSQQSSETEAEGQQQEKSQAEEFVDGYDGQPEMEVLRTLLPQDDLPDLDAAAGDEIASEGEVKNCPGELQSSSRPTSPMLATEDSVKSDSVRASSELNKQDQDPEVPVAEDQILSVHAENETLAEIEEEHFEKEHLEEQQTICIDPVSRTTNNMVPQESMRDAGGEIVEVAAVKELSQNINNFKNTENEGSDAEVVVMPSEITVPKRVSNRDIAPSDRCLRRRPQLIGFEPTKVSKTNQVTHHLLQVQGSPVDLLRMSGPTRAHRSVRIKQPAVFNLSENVPQSTEEMPVDKPQLSSEVRPNTGQVVDNMVQTRHKAMLAKQLGNEEGSQGSKAEPATTAGSSTEMVSLKVPNQLAHLKEKLTKNLSVESNIPGDCSMSVEKTSDVCRKIPLTRERSRSGMSSKPMRSATLMKHKKLVLRSQRCSTLAAVSTKVMCEQDQADPVIKTRPEKASPSQSQKRDLDPFGLQKLNLSMPNPPKFLEALRGEENQPQIMSLNTKYDKMQRGWVQLDKEGQPAQRPRNKADRLKEIWKSKRRVRKPKPLDHQKYSPVQMLFMKTFDLSSICHWFLQTTETKSLVIVKKVNTRLPSETQLCFHSSSSTAGSTHGVFSSLQAERLKKHLKKFAVASPVKSNAKNQKLIAKAWEQEVPCSKGKEKVKELTSATRISTKPYSNPRKLEPRAAESQKTTAVIKSPASARILRKYTNIREKLHVQQHARKPREIAVENLKSTCVKPLLSPKLISKPKALPEHRKKTGENGGKELYASKNVKASSKRDTLKKTVKEKATKSSGRKPLQILCKKGSKALKKAPPVSSAASGPRKPCASSPAASGLKHRAAVPTRASKGTREQKDRIVKSAPPKARDSKLQIKTALKNKVLGSKTVRLQRPEALRLPSQDQVLTRSQRKMETMPSMGGVVRPSLKRSQKILPTPTKRTRT
ncbi:hypothetical protein SKAU_G00168070 [Synaphobranchus kaupii]|uniref:Uncharacterized protein n=1 Tax=Synaphobranchus kaupii TaxID=118154 RepID=A0A9Q1FKC7_SYNKA|nr:hypothetical protein SKAU_G00168070 [Synaphobranchus kaupii]